MPRNKRDNEALELFNANYNNAVYYIYSLSKNFSLAEDIVCDCFFKALETLPNGTNFRLWLFTICRNAMISKLRKQKKQVALNENIVYEDEEAVKKLIINEEYRALHKAIELLPELYRTTVRLYYFDEMSIKEIAILTEKEENYVKIILFRAREKLKNILLNDN